MILTKNKRSEKNI